MMTTIIKASLRPTKNFSENKQKQQRYGVQKICYNTCPKWELGAEASKDTHGCAYYQNNQNFSRDIPRYISNETTSPFEQRELPESDEEWLLRSLSVEKSSHEGKSDLDDFVLDEIYSLIEFMVNTTPEENSEPDTLPVAFDTSDALGSVDAKERRKGKKKGKWKKKKNIN
ncbi:hypothetical protein Q3G72_021396 [Acer saccharum]|nr:hypothetical protein Q3G72_021396 [Acer saccharum]